MPKFLIKIELDNYSPVTEDPGLLNEYMAYILSQIERDYRLKVLTVNEVEK